MHPILRRIIAALVTAAAAVGLFAYCPLAWLPVVIMVFSALVQLEFYQLVRAYAPQPFFGILAGTLYLVLTAALPGADGVFETVGYAAYAFVPAFFLFSVYVLFKPSLTRPLATMGSTLLGFFYVPFLMAFFLRYAQLGLEDSCLDGGLFAMPTARTGLYTLLALVAVTKLSDMGGFAFGLAFGRHKMCPTISPKKSWEGFLGSLVGSSLMALAFRALAIRFDWAVDVPVWDCVTPGVAVAGGCLVAVCATLGDLIESRFKRECAVKDSSAFLPAGMGGFLDMFDSILFMPALFYPVFAFGSL